MIKRPKRPGFSLIEVLVAMAVAVILILGTGEILASSLRAKKKGDLASGLAHAALARLETLKTFAFDAAELEPGGYADVVVDEISRETLLQDWTVEEEGGLKRIVLVTRSEDYPASELRLVLFYSQAMGFRP